MNQDLYNHGLVSQLQTPGPGTWTRNSEWLAMPSVSPTESKVVYLCRINNDTSNYIAFNMTCVGGYTVDWGDGTTSTPASAAIVYKQYDYATVSGSPTSEGFKQVIITVTPTVGTNKITSAILSVKHNAAGLGGYHSLILDMIVSLPTATTINLGSNTNINPPLTYLERVQVIACALTNASYLFGNLTTLRSASFSSSATVTNLSGMFNNCFSLTDIPTNLPFNTATDVGSMFSRCRSLVYCPTINLGPASVNVGSMFANCPNLKNIPFTASSWAKMSTLSSTFTGCSALTRVPAITISIATSLNNTFSNCGALLTVGEITSSASLTDVAACFSGCFLLSSLPNITNTSAVTSFSSFAVNCYRIESCPAYNTSSTTSMNAMFQNCYKLKTVPNFNYSKCLNTQSMFNNCQSLQKVGTIDFGTTLTGTLNISNMFSCNNAFDSGIIEIGAVIVPSTLTALNAGSFALNGVRLRTINVDCTKITSTTNISSFVSGSTALVSAILTGLKYGGITLTGTMDATALIALFNSLGTAAGAQTLTVSGNPGWANLTAGDKAIATGKGWTLA